MNGPRKSFLKPQGLSGEKAAHYHLKATVYSVNCLSVSQGTTRLLAEKAAMPCPAVCYNLHFILWSLREHFWGISFVLSGTFRNLPGYSWRVNQM